MRRTMPPRLTSAAAQTSRSISWNSSEAIPRKPLLPHADREERRGVLPVRILAHQVENLQIPVEVRRIPERQVDPPGFYHDRLVMREGVESPFPVIGAVSACADAAERKFRIDDVRDGFIDRDAAGGGTCQKMFQIAESA